jgi:hypothetical protein
MYKRLNNFYEENESDRKRFKKIDRIELINFIIWKSNIKNIHNELTHNDFKIINRYVSDIDYD